MSDFASQFSDLGYDLLDLDSLIYISRDTNVSRTQDCPLECETCKKSCQHCKDGGQTGT